VRIAQRFYSPKGFYLVAGVFALLWTLVVGLIIGALFVKARGPILPRAAVSAVLLIMLYGVVTMAFSGVWVGRRRVVVVNLGFFRIIQPHRIRRISLDESGSLAAPTVVHLDTGSITTWGIHARLVPLSGGSRQDALAELRALRSALKDRGARVVDR
jgi:hypothetical protein